MQGERFYCTKNLNLSTLQTACSKVIKLIGQVELYIWEKDQFTAMRVIAFLKTIGVIIEVEAFMLEAKVVTLMPPTASFKTIKPMKEVPFSLKLSVPIVTHQIVLSFLTRLLVEGPYSFHFFRFILNQTTVYFGKIMR